MDNSSSEDSSVSVKPHTLLKLMNHLVSRAPGSSNLQYYPSQSFDMSMKKASHNEFRNYGKMIRKNSWSCPTLAQGTLTYFLTNYKPKMTKNLSK